MKFPKEMHNAGQLALYYKVLAAYFNKTAGKKRYYYQNPALDYASDDTYWLECNPLDEVEPTVEELYKEVFELSYTTLNSLCFNIDASGDNPVLCLQPQDVVVCFGKNRALELLESYKEDDPECFDYDIDFDIDRADAVHREWSNADWKSLAKGLKKGVASAQRFFETMLNVTYLFFSDVWEIASCNFPLFYEMYSRYKEYLDTEPNTEFCCVGRGYMICSHELYELLYPSRKKGRYKRRRKKAFSFIKSLEGIIEMDTFIDGVFIDHYNKTVAFCASVLLDADYDAYYPMNNINPKICPVLCELDRYLEQVTNK